MAVAKKYLDRPSPPVSAALYPEKTMRGNDGNDYFSDPDKNGRYRWVLSGVRQGTALWYKKLTQDNIKRSSKKSKRSSRSRKGKRSSKKSKRKSRKGKGRPRGSKNRKSARKSRSRKGKGRPRKSRNRLFSSAWFCCRANSTLLSLISY